MERAPPTLLFLHLQSRCPCVSGLPLAWPRAGSWEGPSLLGASGAWLGTSWVAQREREQISDLCSLAMGLRVALGTDHWASVLTHGDHVST